MIVAENVNTLDFLEKHPSQLAKATLKGEKMIVTYANEVCMEIWGKGNDVVGKSLYSIMPEVMEQGFGDLLQHVFTTGETYVGNQIAVMILRNEKWDAVQCDFTYEVYYDDKGNKEGISIVAVEVTPGKLKKNL